MRKNPRERFEDHSILYITSLMTGVNMFIFTMLVFIDRLLGGEYLMASIIFSVIFLLILYPYYLAKRRGNDLKKLSNFIKEDLFLMSFSFSFIIVGSILVLVVVFVEYS